MRLWHYKLLPVLPKKMLVSQWRECIAIKRQWENGMLKHRLVSYIKDYDKQYFRNYVDLVCSEMSNRGIIYQRRFLNEIYEFCDDTDNTIQTSPFKNYSEHNNRYLKQCYYNLQEKYDRGIVSNSEWKMIKSIEVEFNE